MKASIAVFAAGALLLLIGGLGDFDLLQQCAIGLTVVFTFMVPLLVSYELAPGRSHFIIVFRMMILWGTGTLVFCLINPALQSAFEETDAEVIYLALFIAAMVLMLIGLRKGTLHVPVKPGTDMPAKKKAETLQELKSTLDTPMRD